MNIDKVIAVGIRLFAISLFLEFIKQTEFLLVFDDADYIKGLTVSSVQMYLSALLPLLISIFLWFFPLTLAKNIIKPEINQDVSKIEIHQFFPAIIIFLGLYILSYAISDLIYFLTKWNLMNQSNYLDGIGYQAEENSFVFSQTISRIITTVLEIILGLFFIFKARFFSVQLLRVAK